MESSKKFKIQLILIIIAAGILVYLILIKSGKKMRDDIVGTFSSGSIMNYEYLVIDSENHFWLYNASNQINGSVIKQEDIITLECGSEVIKAVYKDYRIFVFRQESNEVVVYDKMGDVPTFIR